MLDLIYFLQHKEEMRSCLPPNITKSIREVLRPSGRPRPAPLLSSRRALDEAPDNDEEKFN